MDGKPLAVSVPCTGRKCQYLVTGLRLYSCIDIGIFYHLIDKFLILFARLVSYFIHITAIDRIFIREDSITVGGCLRIYSKVLILFQNPSSLYFSGSQTCFRHSYCDRRWCCNNPKIRFVKTFQKDTPCDVAVAIQVGSQIFLIVTWIQNWIIDAKFVLIIKPYPSDNIWILGFQFVKLYFYVCCPPVFFFCFPSSGSDSSLHTPRQVCHNLWRISIGRCMGKDMHKCYPD